MTWPFENDTSAITKKLAKKSLQSEKRRNLMVVIAVALAAFLICFTGIVSTSLTQMQRNQVVDTYEAVWLGVEENDIETLKGVPEFERVGGYYLLGEELSEQGYHASYVYNDAEMMEIGRDQMSYWRGICPKRQMSCRKRILSFHLWTQCQDRGHCDLRYREFSWPIMSLPAFWTA